MKSQNRIALFIDADNAPAKKIDVIMAEAAKHGVVQIRRAYGNWTTGQLNAWESVLHEYAIQPIQQFDLTKGKNASDIAMVIDVMDVLYTKEVDVICLVTSDCDFTPLVTRTLAEGKSVIGFGERKAPAALVNACSQFLYLDKKTSQHCEKFNAKELQRDKRLITLMKQAIANTENEDGWAMLSNVGKHMRNQSSFDQRNYGYLKIGDLFRAVGYFEVTKHECGGLMVRLLPTAT